MLPDVSHPIGQTADELKGVAKRADDRLRAAAARAEGEPARKHLKAAMKLLHQFRGVIAAANLELPIDVEQAYSTLVHEDVLTRKEQQR
jgi:hypothetical protein